MATLPTELGLMSTKLLGVINTYTRELVHLQQEMEELLKTGIPEKEKQSLGQLLDMISSLERRSRMDFENADTVEDKDRIRNDLHIVR